MSLRLKLFALLLAVPLLAIGVGLAGRYRMDDELRGVVRAAGVNAGRPIPENQLAMFSMAQACSDPGFRDSSSACSSYSGLSWLALAGAAAGAAGFILVAAIAWAGRACRRDRRLLVKVFRPGLRAVFLVLIVLILVHAALVIGSLLLMGATGGGIGRVMLMVGIGAILAVYRLIQQTTRVVEKASVHVVGKVLESGKHQRLIDGVGEVARRIGADAPDRVVAGLDPNFFVTEADVTCLDGQLSGRTLYVSLPLCRILTATEVKAIIGHELGHFKGLDTQFSQRFYPIYAGASRSLAVLAESAGGARSVAILPAFYLLAFFLESFATAEAAISRERELAADAEAASAAGSDAIASALVKVHAYTPAWLAVMDGMRRALGERRALTNVSTAFADIVCRAAAPERVHEAANVHLAHPTDSHPPLVDRLASLGRSLEELMQPSLALPPAPAAIGLFDEAERLEEELSRAQHEWLLATGQATLGREIAETAGS